MNLQSSIIELKGIEHIFYFIFIYLNFYIFLTNFIKSIAFLVENDIIYIRNHTLWLRSERGGS